MMGAMLVDAPMPDDETMYDAFVRRDASFEGLFVMGVRTTGIFCRPTCPARKPLRANVEFFPRAGDALAAGYRPCRRCRPLEAKGTLPDWLRPLMDAVDENPLRRWTTADLRELGVEPARARRWFQAQHGMTLLAYLRSRRLGQAFSRLREGADLMDIASQTDFDSVSGFCEALRRRTGEAPGKSRRRLALHVTQVPSPLGPIMVAGDEEAVYLIEFWDRRMLETQFQVLERRLNAVFFPGTNAPLRQMARELTEYFAGKRRSFEVPLRFPGTAHQERVWRELLRVPYGKTLSYGELARRIGSVAKTRAVARAVGENRFAIVLPCHRVLGSDGALTGYGGGLWRKRYLLELEKR